MKKLLAVVLCMIIVLSLGACSSKNTSNTSNTSTFEELEKMQNILSDGFDACGEFASLVLSYWDDIEDYWFNIAEATDYMKEYAPTQYEVVSARVSLKKSFESINSKFKSINPSEENQEYYDSLKELYLCVDSYFKFVKEYPNGYSYNSYLEKTAEFKSKFNEIESEISIIK